MDELIKKVEAWADARGLLKEENAPRQFMKVAEEFGEIGAALARNNKTDLEDSIGDTMVTLIILARQKGLNLKGSLELAYDMIKDRKGATKDGVFVKEEDLK